MLVEPVLTGAEYSGSLDIRVRSVAVIDQELSRYYHHREAVARASALRASDARARRMHLEMASMYARALRVGCRVVDLLDDTRRLYLINDETPQMDEAA